MAANNRQRATQQPPGPGTSDEQAPGPGGESKPAAATGLLDVADAELNPDTQPKKTEDLDDGRRGKQGDDSRPYCPRHNCLLKCDGSTKVATKYRCPVRGCETREKRARPQVKIPAEPMACPSRSCSGDKHFLEANPDLSTVANLHMECVACGFHVKVPRPQFTPQLARQRAAAAAESFDDR